MSGSWCLSNSSFFPPAFPQAGRTHRKLVSFPTPPQEFVDGSSWAHLENQKVQDWEFLWDEPGMQKYFTGEENLYLSECLWVFFSTVNPGHLLALG